MILDFSSNVPILDFTIPFSSALLGGGLELTPTPIVCDLCKDFLRAASFKSSAVTADVSSNVLLSGSTVVASEFFLSILGLWGTEPVLESKNSYQLFTITTIRITV